MDDIQSIADIALLLRERDKHPYGYSYVSDSRESKMAMAIGNVLDSKIFSEKDYRQRQESSLQQYRPRPQLSSGSMLGLQSALYSDLLSPAADPNRKQSKSVIGEESRLEDNLPAYLRIRMLQLKSKKKSLPLQEQQLRVVFQHQERKLEGGRPAQFRLREDVLETDLQIQFFRGEGLAIEPQQNVLACFEAYSGPLSSKKMFNFIYHKSEKTTFAYLLQLSSSPYFNRARVRASLTFESEYKQVNIQNQSGQYLFESKAEGKSVELDVVVELQGLEEEYRLLLDEGASCWLRLQTGEYPVESAEGGFLGLARVAVLQTELLQQ